ncbi:NADPH-dependent FMN reductase [Streptomyces sp. NRRL S-31]|uniref:NADPH-dependent FMN reductase n=1 Tax=Streptomyces sp. NRRL S-31 TaxID=1463898 RepID=UPI00069AB874|nr:NADPH-dependent FMN reductase [Streptomyces sp. NRRL S-31]
MILGILGSASKDSNTRHGLAAVAQRIRAAGGEFETVDLSVEFSEPHDIGDYDDPAAHSQTAAIRRRIAEADGVILATPVYHGSYSGLLKNFLDHLEGDAFAGKPVGILANGGGPRSAVAACDQLRTVVRAISGWAVPAHVATANSDFTDGVPGAAIAGRMDAMVADLLMFTDARSAAAGSRAADV